MTYGGKTHALSSRSSSWPRRTRIEQAGTYPLPEAQLDRFLLYIQIGYPDESEEITMLAQTTGQRLATVSPVMTAAELRRLQSLAREVAISGELIAVRRPAGPRHAGQVAAVHRKVGALGGWAACGSVAHPRREGPRAAFRPVRRDPDDLRALAAPVLRHRLLLNFEAESENIRPDDVAAELFKLVPAPKSPLA